MSTYTPIASQTLGSSAATVTFTNIPQNFTDLVLVINARTDRSGQATDGLNIKFNTDDNSNYSDTEIIGNGSSASSVRNTNTSRWFTNDANLPGATATASVFSSIIVSFQNYANTSTYKTGLCRFNLASSNTGASVGLWRSTSALDAITLISRNNANFVSGSTFNLYGIASASASTGKASGGNIVTTDGTYWYHTFTSSGTFTPLQALTADYLVVAGGGGGGNSYGAGGGAGGLRCTVGATGGGGSLETPLSLTAQAYTVTVGAGGANNAAGSNSVFSTITSTGGGVGGAGSNAGGAGGSGGGAGGNNGTTGGTGTANQGYNGGSGAVSGGGGGGGAGGLGGNASSNTGGNGGIGVTTSISGTSTTYAGGGGGYGQSTRGVGGSSIGGSGGQVSPALAATNGVANTGSGGGGEPSGAGGSGIVIVRYAV